MINLSAAKEETTYIRRAKNNPSSSKSDRSKSWPLLQDRKQTPVMISSRSWPCLQSSCIVHTHHIQHGLIPKKAQFCFYIFTAVRSFNSKKYTRTKMELNSMALILRRILCTGNASTNFHVRHKRVFPILPTGILYKMPIRSHPPFQSSIWISCKTWWKQFAHQLGETPPVAPPPPNNRIWELPLNHVYTAQELLSFNHSHTKVRKLNVWHDGAEKNSCT